MVLVLGDFPAERAVPGGRPLPDKGALPAGGVVEGWTLCRVPDETNVLRAGPARPWGSRRSAIGGRGGIANNPPKLRIDKEGERETMKSRGGAGTCDDPGLTGI